MTTLTGRLTQDLQKLRDAERLRSLPSVKGLSFISNDYLRLSTHPEVLKEVLHAVSDGTGLGATGSRLLSGNTWLHSQTEKEFAHFVAREAALYFSSGYMANLALLSTLPCRHDLIILDDLVHASLKEGARSSFATKRTFSHNNLKELEVALRDRRAFQDVFVVVEGVYSMDGDAAPLREIMLLTESCNAQLIVDEAHSTGLYGEHLRGLHEDCKDISLPLATVHPCGKALGASGAFVAGEQLIIDYLINHARPFIYSTAPSPLCMVGLRAAIRTLPSMKSEVETLFSNVELLRGRLQRGLCRWHTIASDSPIVPVVIGKTTETMRAVERLFQQGVSVLPIRPPTVREGKARLRLTITTGHKEEDVEHLADVILAAEKEER